MFRIFMVIFAQSEIKSRQRWETSVKIQRREDKKTLSRRHVTEEQQKHFYIVELASALVLVDSTRRRRKHVWDTNLHACRMVLTSTLNLNETWRGGEREMTRSGSYFKIKHRLQKHTPLWCRRAKIVTWRS
ncbi:hypothetical protein TRVL_05058 [Trypanosoma vivax]|nr:hypothetical protein TRVL_05058 [Trypanosoma vivax]